MSHRDCSLSLSRRDGAIHLGRLRSRVERPYFAFVILPRILMAFLLAASAAGKEPSFDEVNTACGVSLFMDENLWDDEAPSVALRLAWPLESETSLDSSYRRYPDDQARFLGARPFSQVLYAEQGKPSGLSLVFANKGDAVSTVTGLPGNRELRERRAELRGNRKAIEADEKTLGAALSGLFGKPSTARFGQGSRTRETVQRWDWRGHVFLLSAPRGEYVALRILPTASADNGGRSRLSDDVIRQRVTSRVQRRPNGDVVVADIPMVNQGPKGYCVPATWERVMRFMGVPADMYVLAMAGNTGAGGGTSGQDIMWGARDAITRAGRRLDGPSLKLQPAAVAKFIDRGLPIMWAMYSTPEMNRAVNGRLAARQAMTDPSSWAALLAGAREAAKKMTKDRETAHLCMITGYNKQTGELAFSDSYGPDFEERWITVEEAEAVSQGLFYVIEF